MSRTSILARIRAVTHASNQTASLTHTIPASLVTSGAEAISRFRSIAEAKGVTVIEVENPDALPGAIARALAEPRTPIRTNDPAFSALPWTKAGLTLEHGAGTPHDTVALSRAHAAVAETGTLMLVSGPENPTTLAFLPETHIVTVARSDVVGTFENAIAVLRRNFGSELPRSVNFISGASRTGDIGGRIVQGAHGPRRLIVVVT